MNAQKQDAGVQSIVITFYPHPAVVLAGQASRMPIRTLHDTHRILSEYNVDVYLPVRFTKAFSKIRASDFIESFLFRQLNVKALVVGEDAAVGYQREGTAEFLEQAFQKSGRCCDVVRFACADDEKISSGTIRELLSEGHYAEAIDLLGEPIVLESRTKRGQQLGRELGFPTLNAEHFAQHMPRYGIYTSLTELQGQVYKGVTSIGVRPSVADSKFVVETHLFRSPGSECYGLPVKTSLLHRLRDELKFDSLDSLKEQIQWDCNQAKDLLANVEERRDALYQVPL